VGYTGGLSPGPTYRQMADHTESVQVDYDPGRTAYEELLAVFWSAHNPTRKTWRRQYMSAIFFHDPGQERLARAGAKREAARRGRPVATRILAASSFYPAEFYHQKYYLQQNRTLMGNMRAAYPADQDLIDSTAAARLNGYLGGYGTIGQLQGEMAGLGLTASARQHLLETMGRRPAGD
jgi:peptide-methionine (S)-S-oxide reductase